MMVCLRSVGRSDRASVGVRQENLNLRLTLKNSRETDPIGENHAAGSHT